jgi:hypothetical protein
VNCAARARVAVMVKVSCLIDFAADGKELVYRLAYE